jgi:hypothetical protein
MMTKDVAYMLISLALVMSWQMIHVVGDVFAPRTIEPYFVHKVMHKPTSFPRKDEATKATCFKAKLSIKLSKTYSDGSKPNKSKELHFSDMIGRNSSHGLPFNLSVDKLETIYSEPNADLNQYLWPADDQPYNITSLIAEVRSTPEAQRKEVCFSLDQDIIMGLKYTNAGSVEYEMFDLTVASDYINYGQFAAYAKDMLGIQ